MMDDDNDADFFFFVCLFFDPPKVLLFFFYYFIYIYIYTYFFSASGRLGRSHRCDAMETCRRVYIYTFALHILLVPVFCFALPCSLFLYLCRRRRRRSQNCLLFSTSFFSAIVMLYKINCLNRRHNRV